ncbi:LysR family transcriptional regulator [Catenuloplanes atrovinosus]|uniref:DNA-binding transcriptional LysR family regulator n=1 Tax=Catenuloplanes atrovinosus TaxID=137266 RepID=A0AAE3YP52_9ACTN|nr:LysR family transcriptional regulator [Catenuloplanes atrovinosus]MDR7276077.1 DNA-binding transcriptional LysR family regulator [Catenuloplanes atrovinosus]
MVPDLDLRLVRYFTVVAERLNFARAAEELRVAQPSLSRQIQRLEDALGVRLLERSTQGSRLTAAGAAFLPRAQRLLHAAEQSVLTARAAAPARTITIGYADDLIITTAVRDLRHRFPEAHVRVRHLGTRDAGTLAARQVDALVARTPLPVPAGDLEVTVLYDEPRVLVVPATHRLAGKESVTTADLAAEPLVGCTGMGGDWTAFWRLEPRADGAPAPLGATLADTYDDKLEAVADGDAVALVPAGDRRFTLRPDLVTVPVEDLEPCQVVVATRAGDADPLVAEFVRSARNLLAR